MVCATIPEGILAGSGSKNDYVLAFWLVALAYYAMRFRRDPGWLNGAGLGAALGLAWLTKGTGYVIATPLLATLWLFWPWKVKVGLVKRLPLIIVLAVGLNAGHFVRNYSFYRSPFGPQAEESGQFKYANDVVSIPIALSNIVRNTALHVRSAHRADNAVIERWIARSLRWIGADVDDPRTNFFSSMPFQLPEMQVHEGLAGNRAHLALLVATLVVLAVRGYRPERRAVAVYALGLILSYVAFCAVLKWQPLHARLHLPLFVLWSAATGAVIGAAWPAAAVRGVAIVLLLLALPMATRNDARPVVAPRQASVFVADRAAQYFGDRRELERPYLAAVDFVKKTGCRDVGLDLSAKVGAQYEYPLLALLGAGTEREVRAIAVVNASAGYARRHGAFSPCAVICVLCERAGRQWERYEGSAATPAVFGASWSSLRTGTMRLGGLQRLFESPRPSLPMPGSRSQPHCRL